jgi:hypothetical protein
MKTIGKHVSFGIRVLVPLLLGLLSVQAATDPLVAVRDRLSASRKPSVLFIGNSYSFQAPSFFRTHANNRGRAVRVEQVSHGGWTLAKHADNEATLKKIREGGWDVVVLQEQSRIPSLPEESRARLMDPPLRKLADEIRRHGAVPVLYQTWGYREGDAKRPGDGFQAMTGRLREGYRNAARKAGGLAVVPVGDAWEREFNAGNSGKLFQPDGSHPSRFGNQVTARTFFEKLLK